MTPARWLADKSALWRVDHDAVAEVLEPRIQRGLVGVSIVTELEVGFSARSVDDHEQRQSAVMSRVLHVGMSARAESRAREVQVGLLRRGQHRGVSVPDLLIAATAEIERLTVLHYDADFDLIADVTGQPMEWVVPPGSI